MSKPDYYWDATAARRRAYEALHARCNYGKDGGSAGPCYWCNAPDSPRVSRRRWLCKPCQNKASTPDPVMNALIGRVLGAPQTS